MKLREGIQDQLERLVADNGLELLSVEVSGSGSRTILRLVVEGTEGVSLDQCAGVSRQASALLDVEEPIGHAYTLEVSSPGLDRKFYRREDYERFTGHPVRVRMKPSYREHRVVVGELRGLDGDTLRVLTDDGQTVGLPSAEVFEARLEVDWKKLFGEGKSRR
jgi:ribosome maturation factor RimP